MNGFWDSILRSQLTMSNAVEVWSLTLKEYNEKIAELQDSILSLTPCSEEWMMAIFQQWLHIANPHPWQIKHSLSLCNSQEVFITSRTGSGKSALALAPVIARRVLRKPYIAIAVYPTEALMTDQVRFKPEEEDKTTYIFQEAKAHTRGIQFITITSNMISNILIATHCNVWKEVADGEWDVITMGPEMLQSKAVGLLKDLRRRLVWYMLMKHT